MADVKVTIKYWIAQNDEYPLYYRENGAPKGAYGQFLNRLSDYGNVETELVLEHNGTPVTAAEALEMLRTGELDLVLGLSAEMQRQEENGIIASNVIYRNHLTAVTGKDSPEVPADSVDACYWGIEQDYLALTEGTALDGHILDFNSRAEMYEALEAGSIYGALIKKSSLDYDAYVRGRFAYRHCPVISMEYDECVYMRASDTELAEAVNAICSELAEKYLDSENTEESGVKTALPEDGYLSLLADAYDANTCLTAAACAGIVCAIVFGVLAAVFSAKCKKLKERERHKLATFVADNPAKELYELDIKKKELYAYNGFSVFGKLPAEMPNPISLEKLSAFLGYDFTGHFSGVTLHGNTIYHNRLILHKGGEKLYISEDGHRVGDVLFFTMTDVREDDKKK